jgi:hypothetical protein
MALSIPNLDKIQKADPKLGEALQKIKNYVTLNTTVTAGNKIPVPPTNPSQVRG